MRAIGIRIPDTLNNREPAIEIHVVHSLHRRMQTHHGIEAQHVRLRNANRGPALIVCAHAMRYQHVETVIAARHLNNDERLARELKELPDQIQQRRASKRTDRKATEHDWQHADCCALQKFSSVHTVIQVGILPS